MPLQNRVDPFGTLFRTSARGTFMGNRGGALHTVDREVVRAFKSRRWITCVLEFRRRRRTVMSPNRYTELFFLDEAVAFAAGHRPCAECRRERFNAFKKAWQSRGAASQNTWVGADEIDAELHQNRIDNQRNKVTFNAPLDGLPDGSFVQIGGQPHLVWNNALLLWTPEGYTKKLPRPDGLTVTVLTPRPIVECFAQGYRPEIHESGYSAPA
jgi:hypothetical protein